MNRGDVRKLILEIEEKHNVDEWTHNDYFIWPILRLKMYMYLVWESNQENKKKFINFTYVYKKIVSFIIESIRIVFKIKERRNIYIGNTHNFSIVNRRLFNRYFDKLMDEDKNAIYFSKSISKKNVYRPDRHFLFNNLLFGYKAIKLISGYRPKQPSQIHEICDFLNKKGIDSVEFKKEAISFVRNVDLSMSLSKMVLRKINPGIVWVLCYYSADVLGFLIAAHKLSIPTIDMQHGGQGKNHLAYSAWSKVPKNGYEALPEKFYTWDVQSAQEINQWAEKTNKHSAVHFGNPWVNGWKRGEFEGRSFKWPKNLILYTMQPVEIPLENYLLKTIQRTMNKWNWWLRLHPRHEEEKEVIINLLKEFEVYKYVNIYDATEIPLPDILNHTSVHITKFSGCTLEAQEFGVCTLLIDEIGRDVFSTNSRKVDLIQECFSKNPDDLISNIDLVFSRT